MGGPTLTRNLLPPPRNWFHVVKDNLTAAVAIIAALSAFGVTIGTPWPSKADIDELSKQMKALEIKTDRQLLDTNTQIKDLLEDQQRINKTTLGIQKIFLKLELEEAKKDLAANPGSRSAKLRVDELQETIRSVESQLIGSPHP